MSLYNGIDTIAIASLGNYSETYGVGEEGNLANLVVSFGLFEDAPATGAEEFVYRGNFFGFF